MPGEARLRPSSPAFVWVSCSGYFSLSVVDVGYYICVRCTARRSDICVNDEVTPPPPPPTDLSLPAPQGVVTMLQCHTVTMLQCHNAPRDCSVTASLSSFPMSPAPAPSHLGSVSFSLLPPTGYFGDTDRDDGRYPPRPRPPAGTCSSSGGWGAAVPRTRSASGSAATENWWLCLCERVRAGACPCVDTHLYTHTDTHTSHTRVCTPVLTGACAYTPLYRCVLYFLAKVVFLLRGVADAHHCVSLRRTKRSFGPCVGFTMR